MNRAPTTASPQSPTAKWDSWRNALDRSISARFEEQAQRYSERLAVDTRGRRLTYGELVRWANGVASAILEQSPIGAGRAALLVGRDGSLPAAMLGALKAGKTCVVLDPTNPPDRLSWILADAQADVILTDWLHRPMAARLSSADRGWIDVEAADAQSCAVRFPENAPDAPALILYTSGSEGRPKGVLHSHRAALHAAMRHTRHLGLGPEDRVSLLTSPAFSAAQASILVTLLNGATLVPLGEAKADLTHVGRWIGDEGITVTHMVPTVFRHLVETLSGAEDLSRWRVVLLGGETITKRDVELFRRHMPSGCSLLTELGSTEAFVYRLFPIARDAQITSPSVPAGYPVEDMEVLLLDEEGREVGAGEEGELAIRSRYLALGYWRRPDAEREAFVPDPRGGNGRVYLTGDLGRIESDGCLHVLGRKDLQVKIHGQRVEVGEIESALLDLPSVSEAVVAAPRDETGHARLVAYVATKPGATWSDSDLRRALGQRLPESMLPSRFVRVEALPRTSTGKIDRRALRPTQPAGGSGPGPVEEVGDAVQEELRALWKDLLRVESVALHQNFFELGGDSLLVVQLGLEIERRFRAEIDLDDFLVDPTIAHLAGLLRGARVRQHPSPLVLLQSQGSKPPFFCVHGISGNALAFTQLARAIGPERPFYGLQARALHTPDQPDASVEGMAEEYLAAVREVQPNGPYRLGGYSFGGAVALEMAQQLIAQGEQVSVLVILDQAPMHSDYLKVTWNPTTWTWRFAGGLMRSLPYRVRHDLRLGPDQRLFLGLKTRQAGQALRRLLEAVRRETKPGDGRGSINHGKRLPAHIRRPWEYQQFYWSQVAGDERLREALDARLQAQIDYVPVPYPGRIVLIRSRREPFFCSYDPSLGWSELASQGLTVRIVDGDHDSILSPPDVRGLARELRACLTQVDAETSGRERASVRTGR